MLSGAWQIRFSIKQIELWRFYDDFDSHPNCLNLNFSIINFRNAKINVCVSLSPTFPRSCSMVQYIHNGFDNEIPTVLLFSFFFFSRLLDNTKTLSFRLFIGHSAIQEHTLSPSAFYLFVLVKRGTLSASSTCYKIILLRWQS